MSKNKIKFNNFKPFGGMIQSFSQKPITLIYGPNSIGKSSLIHLMAYRNYIQTFKKYDAFEIDEFGDSISLGGFMNFVHQKTKNNTITLEYNMMNVNNKYQVDIAIEIGMPSRSIGTTAVPFQLQYTIDDEQFIMVDGLGIEINVNHKIIQNWLSQIQEKGKWTKKELDLYVDGMPYGYRLKQSVKDFLANVFISPSTDAIASTSEMEQDYRKRLKERFLSWSKADEKKKYKVDKQIEYENIDLWGKYDLKNHDQDNSKEIFRYLEYYLLDQEDTLTLSRILTHMAVEVAYSINTVFEQRKRKFMYIGPLRFYPQRNLSFNQLNQLSHTSESFWSYLKNTPSLIGKLNVLLKELSIPYRIELRKAYYIDKIFDKLDEVTEEELADNAPFIEELAFIDKRTNTSVHNREMGLGVTQLLPILGNSIVSTNTIIAIEQPELHLHPKLQAEIADIFIKMSKKPFENDYLIETHSEHLLLRIMRRMRHTFEGKIEKDDVLALTPDDVCILYVDNDGESTYIQELRLSPKGKLLDHWPNGFFEEGFKERFS